MFGWREGGRYEYYAIKDICIKRNLMQTYTFLYSSNMYKNMVLTRLGLGWGERKVVTMSQISDIRGMKKTPKSFCDISFLL